MKVKAISRSEELHTKEVSHGIQRVQRNLDPSLHPFEKAREYVRALNTTKLDRLFAKPFLASLSGHIDGVYSLAKHPTRLDTIISGSGDGEIKIWDLASKQAKWTQHAHTGFVRGLTICPFSNMFFSVGDDKIVKMWDQRKQEPLNTYIHRFAFNGIDHHRSKNMFATASTQIDIWDHSRAEPIQTYTWGAETITTTKFNQTEVSILASCGTDRTITLYDLRTNSPVSKVILEMRSNALAWNPMEAFNFTVANEDHNCYTFDMRRMTSAVNVLKDHVSAVMDLDYSPTGQEIVTGSYDRTLRIFKSTSGHSREIYHTKRMQRIFAVKYSMDSKYVLSGSDDGNIRLWKADASEKLGPKSARESAATDYQKQNKERFKHMPEIRRIDRHRKVPKAIKNAGITKRTMINSRQRKEENMRKHSKEGAVPFKAERKKRVLAVEK